jgi:hypothetical protein
MQTKVAIVNATSSATSVKLRAGVVVVSPVISESSQHPVVSASAQAATVSVASVYPVTDASYILLAFSAYLDTTGLLKFIGDVSVVTDATTISVGKIVSDFAVPIDFLQTDFAKNPSDTATVDDTFSRIVSWYRQFQDDATPVDVPSKNMQLVNPVPDSLYVKSGYVFDGYVAADSYFVSQITGLITFYTQTYIAGDYFLEDYVGSSYGPYSG